MDALNHFFVRKQELFDCKIGEKASVYKLFLPLSCGLMQN